MRVHRGYLFWGIFFVLLGGIPLADRLGWVDPGQSGLTGRLWPLIIIAIGLAILLSRSRIALLGTVITALVLGTIAGSMLAWSGGWILDLGDCAARDGSSLHSTQQSGTFSGRAAVELTSSCGSLDVSPASGQDWDLQAGHRGAAPIIDAEAARLAIRSADGSGRQEWVVQLPMSQLDSLVVTANGLRSNVDVSAAALSDLTLTVNAGDAIVDAPGASISDLVATVNAGHAGITLGGPTTGTITANAGSVDLCVPADAALRLQVPGHLAFDTNLDESGLTQVDQTWQRPGTGGPAISLTVSGNAANFELDPPEGCR